MATPMRARLSWKPPSRPRSKMGSVQKSAAVVRIGYITSRDFMSGFQGQGFPIGVFAVSLLGPPAANRVAVLRVDLDRVADTLQLFGHAIVFFLPELTTWLPAKAYGN